MRCNDANTDFLQKLIILFPFNILNNAGYFVHQHVSKSKVLHSTHTHCIYVYFIYLRRHSNFSPRQDMQFTCNVTSRRFRANIVAVQKQ